MTFKTIKTHKGFFLAYGALIVLVVYLLFRPPAYLERYPDPNTPKPIPMAEQ